MENCEVELYHALVTAVDEFSILYKLNFINSRYNCCSLETCICGFSAPSGKKMIHCVGGPAIDYGP